MPNQRNFIVHRAVVTMLILSFLVSVAPKAQAESAVRSALPQTPVQAAAAPADFLSVQGRDVVDGAGNPVLLRGINVDTYYYNYVWNPASAWDYADQADIDYLADLGMNAIRLAVHWRYFDTSLGYDLIDAYLDWCEQAGIYVILDMHVVPPTDDILSGDIWGDPAAQQQLLDLWTAIATRYADRAIIAGYDIYNEPDPPAADDYWTLADSIINAIRAVDTNHILIVEAPFAPGSYDLRLVSDTNVIYSYHDYDPFGITHSGAPWFGDSTLQPDYRYPGSVLESVQWAAYSSSALLYTGQSSSWFYWDSGTVTVPAGVEFATIKPRTGGNSGDVYFDALDVTHNGQAFAIYNGDMEIASSDDVSLPASWTFWSNTGFTGAWSTDAAYHGSRSLQISSDGDGIGAWYQNDWIFTEPLIPVRQGDTLRARGWVRAPSNAGGNIGIGFDYLAANYVDYDRAALAANMQPYLDFAATNNVPLYMGEFGSMSAAPGTTRNKLMRDMIDLMNEAGMHWTLWTLRAGSEPNFSLFFGDDLDHGLAQVLRDGLEVPSSDVWRRTNPGGGGGFATVGAGLQGTMVAAGDMSGAYVSLDGGYLWEPIGAARGLGSTLIGGVGFDPVDRDLFYLGTDAGIYRTTDAGQTVTQVLAGGFVTDIEIPEADETVGYAGVHSAADVADGVVYRTTDRGLTWASVSNGTLPVGLHILELFTDPYVADTVYLLAGEGRFACSAAALYGSRDGGVNWTQLAASLGQIADAVLDPHDPDRLFVSTYGDVVDADYQCVTDDAGGGYLYRGDYTTSWTWTQLTNGSNLTRRNLSVWPEPDAPYALRVVDMDAAEVWESLNVGTTWGFVSDENDWTTGWSDLAHAYEQSGGGNALTHTVDPSDDDALIWADGQFVWITRDDGRTFVPLFTDEVTAGAWRSRGVDNIATNDVVFNADSSYIFLAMPELGCFRSADGGGSWQNCNDPAAVGDWNGYGGNVMTVATDPDRANVVWLTQANQIAGPHTLLKSTDYGATWSAVGTGLPATGVPSGLAVDAASPINQRTLFITWDGDVYASGDDGATWARVLDCNGCRFTAVRDYDGTSYVFAGGEAGLWRSTDGGANWAEVGPTAMRGAQGGDFWLSTWEGVHAIVPDPTVADRIYAVVYGVGRGLYRSDDRGATWTNVLINDYLRDVTLLPGVPNMILAGSSSALAREELGSSGSAPVSVGAADARAVSAASDGTLLSNTGGDAWTTYNDGLAWPLADTVEVDPNDPANAFLGSSGTGYYSATLTLWPVVSIGSFIWEDVDRDGLQDAGEPGIDGATVSLWVDDGTGTFVAATDVATNTVPSQVTGPDGLYYFDNLPEGTYKIRVTPPTGYVPSPVQTTTNDSDASNDSNVAADVGAGVYESTALVLTVGGEPTTGDNETGDFQNLVDANGNMTLDMGFVSASTAVLAISKVLNTAEPVRTGDPVNFTITITNTGGAAVAVLPLVDTYDDDYLGFVSATPAPDDNTDDGTLNWSDLTASVGSDLAPGASVQTVVRFLALRDTGLLPNQSTVNYASVTGALDVNGGTPEVVTDSDDVQALAPTAVLLHARSAQRMGADVVLSWTTVDETRIVGFHIVRTHDDGTEYRLAADAIPAQSAGQPTGASYTFTDTDPAHMGTVHYDLEIVTADGGIIRMDLGRVHAGFTSYLPLLSR